MKISDAVVPLDRIGLEELQLAADLQTRLDRKYIVDPGVVADLISTLSRELLALDINGLRDFSYESVYFDTPALDSYFGSAHGRRRRYKVRTRSYLDSSAGVLEVKTAGGRGHTVKQRLDYDFDSRQHLDSRAREFLALNEINAPIIDLLRPTLITTYQRTTLLAASGARFTIDSDLVCRGIGTECGSVGLAGQVLVETKSPGAVTALDRMLWARGVRPIAVSKYCTGLAALSPGLPANKWNTTLRRHFGWAPVAEAART